MGAWVTQLRKGLVELGVLAALRQGESYGYELLQRLDQDGGFAVTESTVYPLLARLARDGFVRVRAAPSPSGPPRRYYRLTSLGEHRLAELANSWRDVRQSMDHLLGEKK